VWDKLRADALLGTDGFVDQLRPWLKEKPLDPEYRKRERFAARPSLEELFRDVTDKAHGVMNERTTPRAKATRNERIYQAVRVHHYTLREAGDCVGLLYSTISVITKRVHETMKS